MATKNTRPLPGNTWIWVTAAIIISFGTVLAISGLIGPPQAQGTQTDDFIVHMDESIPALMKLYDIPGVSMALVKEGQIVWTAAYGYADTESGRRLTTDTPMRVQSISKPVTAWGVMKLAEQGKIDLDASVTQYLNTWQFPQSRFSAEDITIRQLLSHTAGLPLGDVFTIYSPWEAMPSLEEKLTQEAVLMSEPAEGFSYSNTGYNLLELVIEDVTGQDFAEYMTREVLSPLGMTRSTFVWSDSMNPAVPVGYDLSGESVPVYVYPEKASGGLFATAEDVAAFAVAEMPMFFGSGVLSSASIEAMQTPVSENIGVYSLVFDGYGLGHYIETLPNGVKAISHGGQGTGIMTHLHAVPETGDAIVILTNSQRSWPFIARLLTDWAQWRGFPSVGMGRIIWGQYALWAVIGLVLTAVLLQTLRLVFGLIKGSRKAEAWRRSRPLRYVQASVAVVLIGGLVWCFCQKYLFVASVFPRASLWLGICAFALAAVLLLSALFPVKSKYKAYE